MKRAGERRAAVAVRMALIALAVGLGEAGTAAAQTPADARQLSLDEALGIAEAQSEQISMARAAVLRAEGQQMQARSELYPQIGASLSYSRALASEFEGAFGGGAGEDSTAGPPLPTCQPFMPNPALPLEDRVTQLEGQFNCAEGPGGGIDFSNLPFGRENTYRFGLSVSQNLFAGGRIMAQTRVARSGVETAQIALRQAEAQLALDITQAYYDVVLSDRLVLIAQATLDQSEVTLRQAALAREVGTQPEFELLRAQVTRDNQRPVLIQRRSERDLAYLRLKQLLNIPAGEEIHLTSDLQDAQPVLPTRFAAQNVDGTPAELAAAAATRSAVQEAEQAVLVQENLLDVAESQRLPALVLSSQYGRVAYPNGLFPESLSDSRPNWTVGVSLSVPIFTGGRIRGARKVAEANLLESQARLQQVRELAALDTRSAYEQLASAQAGWEASTGTVEQAERAYQIAEVRYREGISTQVELSDSRILLQQAQANRAMSARTLQVARARVALLPYLPLGAPAGGQGMQQAPQPQQPQQQTPPQQSADASLTAFPGAGGI